MINYRILKTILEALNTHIKINIISTDCIDIDPAMVGSFCKDQIYLSTTINNTNYNYYYFANSTPPIIFDKIYDMCFDRIKCIDNYGTASYSKNGIHFIILADNFDRQRRVADRYKTILILYDDHVCEIGDICIDEQAKKFIIKNYNIFKLPSKMHRFSIYEYCAHTGFMYIPTEKLIMLGVNLSIANYLSEYTHGSAFCYVPIEATNKFIRECKLKTIFE